MADVSTEIRRRIKHMFDVTTLIRKHLMVKAVQIRGLQYLIEIEDKYYLLAQYDNEYVLEKVNTDESFTIIYESEWIVPPAAVVQEIADRLEIEVTIPANEVI